MEAAAAAAVTAEAAAEAAAMVAAEERGWELNKANSLRFRHHTHRYHDPSSSLAKNKNRHRRGHHRNVQDFAADLPPHGDHHDQGCCSISNQNIHSNAMVDSIEILPIFHKLLEDKRSSDCAFTNAATDSSSSRHYDPKEASAAGTKPKSRFHSARSCPDMSVRCDIVEYL